MDQNTLTLDLRSYSAETDSHQHDFHQLVLPVAGQLDMTVGQRSGQVSSQHAAIVAAGESHALPDQSITALWSPTFLICWRRSWNVYPPLSILIRP